MLDSRDQTGEYIRSWDRPQPFPLSPNKTISACASTRVVSAFIRVRSSSRPSTETEHGREREHHGRFRRRNMKIQWGPHGEAPAPVGAAWLEAPSLRRMAAIFFRRWREILSVFVLALLPVAILPFVRDPVYEVSA